MSWSTRLFTVAATAALIIPLAACVPVAGPSGADGTAGSAGAQGEQGAAGESGPQGSTGPQGAQGATGPRGSDGARGPAGATGSQGASGPAGVQGIPGPQGLQGPRGEAATIDAALFYALMPSDNAATVAVGSAVQFPQDGPTTTADITRDSASEITLGTPGVYRVSVQVSVTEAGQLVLVLDGTELAYTVVGRATGTSQITMATLVETISANQVLSVVNPTGSATALTITPLAGGSQAASATLLIELIEAG